MKLTFVLLLTVYICWTNAEICSNITDCVGTVCKPSVDHVHLECIEKHCTCSNDPRACLSVGDCDQNARCFDREGHRTHFHCLDGACLCIRV
ncbi:serine protease inhibitor Cvsi-2-like [Ruditapes philippinarum]|uniref:serine protease inhibitor Cvsi-2-like n=1 Tax=Ruditapes philippinarum TaxID=129788 RepID=UPI00295B7086|nr:serine protease inhibitor Cvsi-2-like [Ruditapes philippinarum]